MTDSISVIIPCFNAEPYLAAAIRSVQAQAQDWRDLEIVVVDDGSSDRSAELVRDTFPEVTLIRQANQGVAAARNTGIRSSRGDWIAFLDADDIWLPGKLQAQMDLLNGMPGCRMSYTAWQVWNSTAPSPPAEVLTALQGQAAELARWSGASGWIYPQLLLDCVVWTSTVLVHRSLLLEAGDFDQTLRIGEDYDLWLRASQLTQILRVARPYALYRMHPTSITRSVPRENYRSLVIHRALERWGYASPDGTRARKGDVDRALADSWIDFASAHFYAGNLSQAQQAARLALRADVWHPGGWKILIRTLLRSRAGGKSPTNLT